MITDEELAALRLKHHQYVTWKGELGPSCAASLDDECEYGKWPCGTVRLLDEVERLRAETAEFKTLWKREVGLA